MNKCQTYIDVEHFSEKHKNPIDYVLIENVKAKLGPECRPDH